APRAAAFNEAGAIYRQKAADANASTGADTWQSYDVWFTAPQWQGDKKVADARMTVVWNGVLVHDDVAIPKPTGMSTGERPGPLPILLQSHASDCPEPVRFRNIWAAEGADMPPRPVR
ncbi:MAG: DUF1080 domain-containing protein, partial [Phycisphaerae bacterium]|nr:DUF1080 domain-containing protein [Phycisphaerae bacterium]